MNYYQKNKNKVEKLRGSFFLMGLIVACSFTFLAFEWTTTSYSTTNFETPFEDTLDITDLPPITYQNDIKPPPVKIVQPTIFDPDIIDIIDDSQGDPDPDPNPTLEPTPDFNPDDWKPVVTKTKTPPPPPIGFATNMPHFKECADLKEEERKVCTSEKMYTHFTNTIHVPANIKFRGTAEYLAYVYFEVNLKGEIDHIKILNDKKHAIPKELEREAFNAVHSLPDLVPGKNYGKPVVVRYQLPIRFTVK